MTDPFANLPRGHYRAILADPPWAFNQTWGQGVAADKYPTLSIDELVALPIGELAAPECALFVWSCWPKLYEMAPIFDAWGFTYKTCAFMWMKADPYKLFALEEDVYMGLGYWTRANSEVCLLATRGRPKRLNADVRQGIIAPRREHSRKPDGIHERIERLVAGPYLEIFARQSNRPNWTYWGNETERFNEKNLVLQSAADQR